MVRENVGVEVVAEEVADVVQNEQCGNLAARRDEWNKPKMREGGAEYTTQIVKGGVCGSGRHSSMEEAGRDAPEIGMVQAWVGQNFLNATF